MAAVQPVGALLLGAVPLPDAAAVFRAAAAACAGVLTRVPDGDTGARADWAGWQHGVLAATPGLEPAPPVPGGDPRRPLLRVAPDTAPASVRFGPLGYAEAAIASYATFERLRLQGAIPDDWRLQVTLPVPPAALAACVAPEDRTSLLPAYTHRLLAELRRIAATIPARRLAIQWLVPAGLGLLEERRRTAADDPDPGVVTPLARLGAVVPLGVELGFALCAGDPARAGSPEPADAGRLVRIANALAEHIGRPLDWVHLPIPRHWTESGPYAPFAGLRLPRHTTLYLGVIHPADGERGARARIARAGAVVSRFGIAADCGWGREPGADAGAILRLHAALAAPVRGAAEPAAP